jgi:hypothetical protein
MSGQREDRDGETPAGTPTETTAMLDTAGLDRLVDVLIELSGGRSNIAG